jgi:hypothetical protein
MRKIIFILLILLALLVAYTVFNQFDAGPARFDVGENLDTSSLVALLNDLYPMPSFDKSNGYYRLWSLTEPPDVDIESDAVFTKYRRLHDPQLDNEKYVKQWLESDESWKYAQKGKKDAGNYTQYKQKRKEILDKSSEWTDFPKKVVDDWCQNLREGKESVLQLKSVYRLLLDRYQKLLDCEHFEDFTLVVKDGKIIYRSPLPNLLAWLHVGKLYLAVNMLDALEGNWEQGTANLLAQIESGKKSIKTSRTLIVNLIGKAVVRMTLHGLISLMNQKECPPGVYQQILDGLPPIQYEEFGHKVPLLAESFSVSQRPKKEGGLFYQVNRTQQYYYDLLAKLYLADKLPPYQWKSHPLENNDVKTGWFWWLQNPAGKSEFQAFVDAKTAKNFLVASFKGYAVKAFYDMVKISAELHLNYTHGKPVREILNGLKTYQTLLDPGSGKPYIWNEQRQLLYSIGFDREDNGGGETNHYKQIEGVDFAAPVILFLK